MIWKINESFAITYDNANYILLEGKKEIPSYYSSLEEFLKLLAKKITLAERIEAGIDIPHLLEKLTDGQQQVVALVKNMPKLVKLQKLVDCERELQKCKDELQRSKGKKNKVRLLPEEGLDRVYKTPSKRLSQKRVNPFMTDSTSVAFDKAITLPNKLVINPKPSKKGV